MPFWRGARVYITIYTASQHIHSADSALAPKPRPENPFAGRRTGANEHDRPPFD